MAFQSSVLRDGQWVTETVDLRDALAASAAPRTLSDGQDVPQTGPPSCGLLSRTVIESPTVHWVLPVRIRNQKHNDIAFVGDHFVQISELQSDGQVHEVLRKSNFGARIRKAVVLGASSQDGADDDTSSIKLEDPDVDMQDAAKGPETFQRQPMPPQLLILMLHSGDAVFLFIRQRPDGQLEFVNTVYRTPGNFKFLGFHHAVDPTSRYMAAASAEGGFIMYELESWDNMNSQYIRTGTIRPVRTVRTRPVNGVIHQMEFLHPRPEDDYHIILLFIVIRKEAVRGTVSRMITYEWELGDNLNNVFQYVKAGTRLPEEHRMPLLIIPLRFKTSFFAVSEGSIGIVKHALGGTPEFEQLQFDVPRPTKLKHGLGAPLWTAWARPFRRKRYYERTDIIFLAREDGAIMHMEIDNADLIPSITNVGSLDTNITTAFTTAFDVFADVLIIGGDAGPGGIWKLPARSDLEQVTSLPNWSPVVDFTTTCLRRRWIDDEELPDVDAKSKLIGAPVRRKPDRIFCISGRGPKSSVTEMRRGIQGRIGLDVDFGEFIRQSWMFPLPVQGEDGFYVLLSLPHSSEVLRLSGDLSQADAVPSETVPFDITARTISATQRRDGMIVQVTEKMTTLVTISQSSHHEHEFTHDIEGITAEAAVCKDDTVVIFATNGQRQLVLVSKIEEMNVLTLHKWEAPGLITCLSLFNASGNTFIAAGLVREHSPVMSIHALDGREIASKSLASWNELTGNIRQGRLEAFTSVCALSDDDNGVRLVYGTRSGHLVTARVSEGNTERILYSVELLGLAPAKVFAFAGSFGGQPVVLACCDNNLLILSNFSTRETVFKTKTTVWPTDANDPSMPAPPIHSAYCLEQSLSGYQNHKSLMLLAGSRILLADIWPHIGPVPRYVPLKGTPTRLIYHQGFDCLIVGHGQPDGKGGISIIDADTGEDIGLFTDQNGSVISQPSGLGSPDDVPTAIHEWNYVKESKMFTFVLVATKQGRLIILSLAKQDGKIRCWTRYKKSGLGEPIWSLVGTDDGIVYCVGNTLHWELLNVANKRLTPMKQLKLDSPATTMRVADGKLSVLTAAHSLLVYDLHTESEETEIELLHNDRVTRPTTHMMDIGDSTKPTGRWPITLLSTQWSGQGSLTGVWIPWGQRDREFEVVFSGDPAIPIRRFRKGHTRPCWMSVSREKKYGCISSTLDNAEILGVCLNGSMQHFTLIDDDLWRLLSLISELARFSAVVNPFTKVQANELRDWQLEPVNDAANKVIDGDVLDRIMRERALESVASIGTGEALILFYLCLERIDGGRHTAGFRNDGDQGKRRFFEFAYDILEHILEPVF